MSIDHPHSGGCSVNFAEKQPHNTHHKNTEFFRMVVQLSATKPFNQFASEMAELSERLRKLDTKIRSARNNDLVKRGATKGLTGAVTQIIS